MEAKLQCELPLNRIFDPYDVCNIIEEIAMLHRITQSTAFAHK